MTMTKQVALVPIILGGLAPMVWAQVPTECYPVETVLTPEGVAPEVSALAFAGDRLVACFRRGHIYTMDTHTRQWERFASGLHTPLGILPGEPGEFFVAQLPELTRVADSDGDGVADVYDTICDDWGMAGNYHEFVAGPVRDKDGNFYVALGCASGNADVRFPVRGTYTRRGRKGKMHYSPVPYRGWVVRISPNGHLTPISCGLRQPNGIGFNPQGDLFVVDNQGDWVGTLPLHHVTPGAFHGHASSLVWDPTFVGNPVEVPIETLAARRKRPAIQFPQHDMAGSVAQPLIDTTQGRFGPYAGQFFVAEWNHPRIHRVALERVDGVYQGACFPFLDGKGLRRGNNRLAFAPDGSLYVGQTSRGWGPTEGLQRIAWTGRVPLDIHTMSLTRTGFELTFTAPLDRESALDPSAYSLQHYYYVYHPEYGSPKTAVTPVQVTAVSVSNDGKRVSLSVDGLATDRVYELRPRGIRATDGRELATRMVAYTLNRLRP